MEKIDAADGRILLRLGYAMARAQLFEDAALRLLEAQRHDVTVPLEERWAELETWLLTWTAGKSANELDVPDEVTADLRAVVRRRNHVAHRAWTFYLAGREKRGVEVYAMWLDEEAQVMGRAYNGLMALRDGWQSRPDSAAQLALWRERVPAAIGDGTVPGTEAEAEAATLEPPEPAA